MPDIYRDISIADDIYRNLTLGFGYISLYNVRWQSFCQNDDTSNVIFVVMKVFLSLVSSRFDSLSKLLSRPMMGLSGHDEGKLSGLKCFEDLSGAGAWEVAEQLRINYDESREALTRHHQRLLNGRWGLYWLSNRGYERIRIFALDCAVTLKSCRDLRCKLRNMHLYCLQYLQIIQWLQRFFMLFVTSCTVANMLPCSVTLRITSRWLQNNSATLLNPFRNFMQHFRYYISLLGLCFYFWD